MASISSTIITTTTVTKDSFESDTASQQNTEIPFQYQAFIDFVGLVGRLFYDDACIVLLDFLAKEQKSFLESDLREKLGWRDALIQQKLYLLEKHLLVVQDTQSNKGPRTPSHWRINHQIYGAVQWRYQQILDRLTKLVEDASRQHEFECSKPGCEARYTALEAASCARALEDEHPLCNKCRSQLKPSEFEQTKQQAKEKRAKALQQLQGLGQALTRVSNMEIPTFPQFSKKEEQKEKEAAAAGESVTSSYPGSSVAVHPSNRTTPTSSGPSPASSTSGALSKAEVLKQKKITPLQISLSSATHVAASSRVIPWFKPGASIANTTNKGGEVLGHRTTSSTTTVPVSTKISFGLRTAKSSISSITSLVGRPPLTTSPITSSSASTTESSKFPATSPAAAPQLITVTSAESAPTVEDEVEDEVEDIEIEVKQLGRKFKLSEITEEIEQNMSDDEYRIYYHSAELRL